MEQYLLNTSVGVVILGVLSSIIYGVLKRFPDLWKKERSLNRDRHGLQEFVPYAIQLGERLSYLREIILKIHVKEFADFLGLDEVAQLEGYERGEEEYPQSLLNKISEFFFIRSDFIIGNSSYIFEALSIKVERESAELMAEGFKPYLLFRRSTEMNGRVCMLKEEQGFCRMKISAESFTLFSDNESLSNLHSFIRAYIASDYENINTFVLNDGEWDATVRCSFYCDKWELLSMFNDPNCHDQFVKELVKSEKAVYKNS